MSEFDLREVFFSFSCKMVANENFVGENYRIPVGMNFSSRAQFSSFHKGTSKVLKILVIGLQTRVANNSSESLIFNIYF